MWVPGCSESRRTIWCCIWGVGALRWASPWPCSSRRRRWPESTPACRWIDWQTGAGRWIRKDLIRSSLASVGTLASTRRISSRRRRVTSVTSWRPVGESVNRTDLRSSRGRARRISPLASSRSHIRVAVEGSIAKDSTRSTILCGPRDARTTRSRYCGSVTSSPTSASDRAATATSAREALSTASTTSSSTPTSFWAADGDHPADSCAAMTSSSTRSLPGPVVRPKVNVMGPGGAARAGPGQLQPRALASRLESTPGSPPARAKARSAATRLPRRWGSILSTIAAISDRRRRVTSSTSCWPVAVS